MTNPSATAEPVSLRKAQRRFTRSLILDAAREVFSARGFRAATLEEVAAAAGTRRSTIYTHFSDKDDILAAIADEWNEAARDVVAKLPGPCPDRAQIDAWLLDVVEFIERERTPSILLSQLGNAVGAPKALSGTGEVLIEGLAASVPAFEDAALPGEAGGVARAHVMILLREMGFAAMHCTDPANRDFGRHLLVAVGDLFERFLKDHAARNG
ncbi:TetR/AcrR family transcriptional regulator [Novosphingobium pentaromativorans]|nr:TetR/AcrR family transcriptional regulator [Novosphingobium pentaromativorans]